MRITLIILLFLFSLSFSNGQSIDKIFTIRKSVQAINNDSDYKIKTLTNDYFVNKDEVTDNGQDLTGYFKNGQLKKMVYSLGLAYCMQTYEYYFSDAGLLFVFEKEQDYPEQKNRSGQFTGLDYSKLVPAYEGRYYFDNCKLFQKKITGHKRMTGRYDDTGFLANMKELVNDLKTSKNK